MKFTDPYIDIPGARVQHLVALRDPWRWVTQEDGVRKGIPRAECFHSGYNRNRDDAERTSVRTKLPLCKTCAARWRGEAYWLQRRSVSMNDVLFRYAD